MLYTIESDNTKLKGKLIKSADVKFNVGEQIEHGGFRYKVSYIIHVFNKVGAYEYTKVGLDR